MPTSAKTPSTDVSLGKTKDLRGGAAEMLPFAPGVDEYWDAFISGILDLGFNGFVFEDPEANHVPNQNEQSYKTFWEPWASTYGFSSVKETNRNNPPLGVHLEYYTWLFREFDKKIQKHSQRLKHESEIYLISHILLARIIAESKNLEEREKWFKMVDEKHGKRCRYHRRMERTSLRRDFREGADGQPGRSGRLLHECHAPHRKRK